MLKQVVSVVIKFHLIIFPFFCLYRELQDGTLRENGIVDGSKIVLTPNVETGLLVSTFFLLTTSIVKIFLITYLNIPTYMFYIFIE